MPAANISMYSSEVVNILINPESVENLLKNVIMYICHETSLFPQFLCMKVARSDV